LRDKVGMKNQQYSMKVGRFTYNSDRLWLHSPTSGKKFEVGITDYEGQLRSKQLRGKPQVVD
jgi:hypothetical protein